MDWNPCKELNVFYRSLFLDYWNKFLRTINYYFCYLRIFYYIFLFLSVLLFYDDYLLVYFL